MEKCSAKGAAVKRGESTAAAKGKLAKGKLACSKAGGSAKGGKVTTTRGPNAYMLWKQQRWSGLKLENPGLAFKDLMRLTSREWAGLEQGEKQHFEDAVRARSAVSKL